MNHNIEELLALMRAEAELFIRTENGNVTRTN